MPDYDFKSLSPIDFEILVRDLLQEEFGVRLESFKSGRDQGIDLRYCSSGDHTLIIQCKHYAESSYSGLLRQLKINELEKVKRLSPNRYILATSLGLTPNQKQELMELFKPFIIAPSDIYGKNDLNNLLTRYPKVETQTIKLWLASVPIFEEILHSKVKNVSRDALKTIQEHAKYYVQNDSFSEALKILDDNNFCIIAGIPGIGKTTLAEMLLLYFVDKGYEIVKITGDISEANSLDYVNQKRIFYYDDFLGQTSLSEKFNKNEDQKLLDFIRTIKSSKVSKLILTTREYILNQARIVYEKIDRANFDLKTCVIDLSKYTRLIRTKILFNHIYFSDLPPEYKKEFLRKRNYLKIIDHKNYSPRIINLMTEFSRISHILPDGYIEFFISNLENPFEIWRHAFEEQLSVPSRNLLITMASMSGEVFWEDLQEAFLAFHQKQSLAYGFVITPQDFIRALKELEGNFIIIEKSKVRTIVNYHNPSVKDFIQNYLASSEAELLTLVKAATFYEQLMWLWEFRENNSVALKFRQTIIKNSTHFIASLRATITSRNCRLIDYAEFDGQNIYKDNWKMSFEARVSLVVSVATKLNNEDSKKFLDEMLTVVQERIESKSADRKDLVQLLIELKDSGLIFQDQKPTILEKAKFFLMCKPDWIEDFKPFCDFIDSFPELITAGEKAAIREDFKDVAINNVSELPSFMPDRDYVFSMYHELDSLSKRFGVKITKMLEELDSYMEILKNDPPYEQNEYDAIIDDYDCDDQEIESVFSVLKETG